MLGSCLLHSFHLVPCLVHIPFLYYYTYWWAWNVHTSNRAFKYVHGLMHCWNTWLSIIMDGQVAHFLSPSLPFYSKALVSTIYITPGSTPQASRFFCPFFQAVVTFFPFFLYCSIYKCQSTCLLNVGYIIVLVGYINVCSNGCACLAKAM